MYYLRTQAAAQAVQFTVEKQGGKSVEPVIPASNLQVVEGSDVMPLTGQTCTMEEGCVTCSA